MALSACDSAAPAKRTGPSVAYERLLGTLYRNTVPTVSAAALAKELAQPAAPLLLDVRTPAEYKVSHIEGARLVPDEAQAAKLLAGIDRSRPVVVYCTVGYRSERLGERLKDLGFGQVRNLYGGLFEWVNAGHPVHDARGVTQNIHPYSALWSPWLERGRKVYD